MRPNTPSRHLQCGNLPPRSLPNRANPFFLLVPHPSPRLRLWHNTITERAHLIYGDATRGEV